MILCHIDYSPQQQLVSSITITGVTNILQLFPYENMAVKNHNSLHGSIIFFVNVIQKKIHFLYSSFIFY